MLLVKEYMQHDVYARHVHTFMLYWTFVACNCSIHVEINNERDLAKNILNCLNFHLSRVFV